MASLLAAACQTTPAVQSNQPFTISEVKVTRANSEIGTVNLAEDLRYKTVREASRYAAGGQEKVLEVTVTRLHFKNPLMSFMVGDNNRMTAVSRVFDKATGNVVATFDTTVQSRGALNGISGAVIAAVQNPINIEQDLATDMSKRLLSQAYGSAYSKSVRDRPVSVMAQPNYPKSYDSLKREFDCASKRQSGFSDGSDEGEPITFEIPKECKTLASAG